MGQPPRTFGGGIHEVSLLIGELRKDVEHLNNNFKMRDDDAIRHREKISSAIEELKTELQKTNSTVDAIQQDVAETKNDITDHQNKLDVWSADRPVAIAAIKDVDTLKTIVAAIKKQETYDKGFWAAFASIGKIGWVIISAITVGVFAIFLQYGMPYLVEILRSP